MGYQITWKTSELPELDNEFKSEWKSDSIDESIRDAKYSLLITLLNMNRTSSFDCRDVMFKINFYRHLIVEKWKRILEKDLTHEEIWFCGYEFAESGKFIDCAETIIESLIVLAQCSDKCSPYDNSDQFYDKYEKISDELIALKDNEINKWDHKFADKYREFQIKDDE